MGFNDAEAALPPHPITPQVMLCPHCLLQGTHSDIMSIPGDFLTNPAFVNWRPPLPFLPPLNNLLLSVLDVRTVLVGRGSLTPRSASLPLERDVPVTLGYSPLPRTWMFGLEMYFGL